MDSQTDTVLPMSYEQREDGLYVNDERVYANLSGGMLHIMLRALSKDVFDSQALMVGMFVYSNEGSDAVLDIETGEVIQEAVPPSGPLVPAKGITVTEIGTHVLVPAVYDDEGNEVTPAVVDDRYHVNAWLSPETTARGEWINWIEQWMANGTLAEQNKSEVALKYQGIELIDPSTIGTPTNVLL